MMDIREELFGRLGMLQVIENEPSYVFNVREYKENSVIASVLTLNYGRISVMVRGSSARAVMQPFVPLKLTLAPSKTDLFFLQDYECCGDSYNFKMPIFFCATYLNELLYHLYNSKETNPLLFGTYVATLEALNQQRHVESSLRNFELTLLESLGYGLSSLDQEGKPLQPQQLYRFGIGMGFIAVNTPVKSHTSKQEFLRTIANLHTSEDTSPANTSTAPAPEANATTTTTTTTTATADSASSVSSWSDDELEEAMRFSKRKVKGPKISASSSASQFGFAQDQYSGLVTPDGRPIGLSELLGPAMLGSVLSKIVKRQFDADTLKQSKELTNALFNFLLGKREIKSRQLYKDYMQVQAAKKAAKEAAAKSGQQTVNTGSTVGATTSTATTDSQSSTSQDSESQSPVDLNAGNNQSEALSEDSAATTTTTTTTSSSSASTKAQEKPTNTGKKLKLEELTANKLEASQSLLEAGAKASAALKEQQEQQKQQKAQAKKATRQRKSTTTATKSKKTKATTSNPESKHSAGMAPLSEHEMLTTLVALALHSPELEPSAALLESEAKAQAELKEQLEQAKKPRKRTSKARKTTKTQED